MFVWWGDELINLYNDAYRAIVGGKHPEALGQPASVVWREIWDQVGPRAEAAMRGNEGTYDEALLLIMERNGYPEETYYTFSYSPVPNDEGGTAASSAPTPTTRSASSASAGWPCCASWPPAPPTRARRRTLARWRARALATNPRDLPFALIYLRRAGRARRASLAGAAGIDAAATPRRPSASRSTSGSALADRARCCAATRRVVVGEPGGDLGRTLPAGAWPRPPARAVALPIAASGRPGGGRAGRRPQPVPPVRRRATAASCRWSAGQIAAGDRQRAAPTRRSGGAPRRWPSSTAPRPRSSATSATSSARR